MDQAGRWDRALGRRQRPGRPSPGELPARGSRSSSISFTRGREATGLARLLHPQDQTQAEDQARQWRQLLKGEGGAVLSEWDRPRRPGLRRRSRRVARLPGASRPPDGVPRIPGTRLVHRQWGGGKRVQDGGGQRLKLAGDAMGRSWSTRRLPSPRPLSQREKAVGCVLETRLRLQLIACSTNDGDAHRHFGRVRIRSCGPRPGP